MVDNCETPKMKKTLEFDLQEGYIVITGIDDFSVDIANPVLSLTSLYKAAFENLTKGEQIEVICTSKLKNASESYSVFESIKRIIDNAMKDLAAEVS